MKTFISLFVIILLFILVEHVNAQDSLQIAPGKTVRITTPYYIKDNLVYRCNDKLVGTILKLDKKSIMIVSKESKSDSTKILSEHIKKIELSVGKKRKTFDGIGVGLLLGAIAGGVLAATQYEQGASDEDYTTEVTILGTAAGGLLGGMVGGGIGAQMYKDRWQEVPLQQLKQENLLAQHRH